MEIRKRGTRKTNRRFRRKKFNRYLQPVQRPHVRGKPGSSELARYLGSHTLLTTLTSELPRGFLSNMYKT